jgi:P-type conjugative transfer protein TrbJ
MKVARRRLIAGAIACSALGSGLTPSTPARADFWGGDLPLLAAILAQTISIVTQTASMVTQLTYQVKMLETMVKNLDHASFLQIVSFINTARYTLNSLTWGVRSMGFTLARIDGEFKQLFAGDKPPPGTTAAEHRQAYQAWHQEVVGSAQVASRQHTSMENLEQHASKTQDLLSKSDAHSGEVASQLQILCQLIGVTNTELLTLNQTLATTGRVLTSMAAAGSQERLHALARQDDARANYTDKGLPVPVPHDMP